MYQMKLSYDQCTPVLSLLVKSLNRSEVLYCIALTQEEAVPVVERKRPTFKNNYTSSVNIQNKQKYKYLF